MFELEKDNNVKKYDNVNAIAMDIVKILNYLDYECDALEKENIFRTLSPRIQNVITELWNKYYLSPKKNGHWTGSQCNSTWIPDDSIIPPNKTSYANQFNLTWEQIKAKHNFKGLRCEKGRFRFDEIAIYSVSLPNFAQLVNSPIRTALHETAFMTLAQNLGMTISEIKSIKECSNDQTPMGHKNLAWHEDVDCSTLYLVPQEIHGNIPHFGGIGMAQILKKYELI